MPEIPTRRSPIHQSLEAAGAEWRLAGGMPCAVRFRAAEAEREAIRTLGLCDMSALAKLGVKGRGAEGWLRDQGIDAPGEVYLSRRLAAGGLIVRLAADEFLLEGGLGDASVATLAERLDAHGGTVLRVERQETTLLLIGSRAIDVLAQTCGINFREATAERLVLTRVAGVNCGVLPERVGDVPAYRLWVDCSYAVYLWTTLVEICQSLDGCVVGAAVVDPEWVA